MGDSVPPIQLSEGPKYKSKPQLLQARNFKPRHWEPRAFSHGGRSDGLVFRHWKRAVPGTNVPVAVIATTTNGNGHEREEHGEDEVMEGVQDENGHPPTTKYEYQYEDEFPSEKWNVQVQIPTYTDEQYETLLKSDDWTKAETDYLMELCQDYDLRWILIADRYEPSDVPKPGSPITAVEENGDAMVLDSAVDGQTLPPPTPTSLYPSRTMESLKSRYYTIAAKLFELRVPPSNMTQDEFSLLENMRNFDAKTESSRKALVEKMFERTKDEADEEKVLLDELSRITKHEDEFLKMRKELYDRLDPAPHKKGSGDESTAMYQTSSGLSVLLQQLLAREKRFKRPPGSGPNGPEVASGSGPKGSSAANAEDRRNDNKSRQSGSSYNRRETLDSQTDQPSNSGPHPPQKKGSQTQRPVKTLTPEDTIKYGVSHPPDRLIGGVSIRHDRVSKIMLGKSAAQTTKLQAALVELEVPLRLVMPTEKVVKDFERLVTQVTILLDVRKVSERVAGEVRVLEEKRRIRVGDVGGDGSGDAGVDGAGPKGVDAEKTVGAESKYSPRVIEDGDVSMIDKPADQTGIEVDGEKEADEAEDQNDNGSDAAGEEDDQEDDAEAENADDGSQADGDVDAEDEDEDNNAEVEDEDDEENQLDSSFVDARDRQVDDEEGGEEEEEEEEEEEGEDDENQAEVEEDEDHEEGEEGEDDEGNGFDVAEASGSEQADEDGNEDEADVDANSADEDEEEEQAADDDEGPDVEEDNDEDEAEVAESPEDGAEEEEEDQEDADEEADEEQAEPEEDAEEEEASELSSRPPSSSHSTRQHRSIANANLHKRSASVISEGSKAGSNRGVVGRKRRRG